MFFRSHNLIPNDATDGKAVTLSDEGYTNLEVYLNSLVEDMMINQNTVGGGSTGLESSLVSRPQIEAYSHNGSIYLKGLENDSIIDIYTYTGSKLMSKGATGNEEAIQLPKGHYIVKVTAADGASALKILNL